MGACTHLSFLFSSTITENGVQIENVKTGPETFRDVKYLSM